MRLAPDGWANSSLTLLQGIHFSQGRQFGVASGYFLAKNADHCMLLHCMFVNKMQVKGQFILGAHMHLGPVQESGPSLGIRTQFWNQDSVLESGLSFETRTVTGMKVLWNLAHILRVLETKLSTPGWILPVLGYVRVLRYQSQDLRQLGHLQT